MAYIWPCEINIGIINNIPKFVFAILKMQYFEQAVQTRQPESTVQNTPINHKTIEKKRCQALFIYSTSVCSIVYFLHYELHSVHMNVDGNMVRVMTARSGREAQLLSF